MTSTPLDPSSIAVAIIGSVCGAEIANYLGPYSVIAAGGAAGACIALSRSEQTTTLKACIFVALMTSISIMLTVSASELIRYAFPSIEIKWLLAPVAIIIGGVGHDWPIIGKWIVSRAGLLFEKRSGIDEGKNG